LGLSSPGLFQPHAFIRLEVYRLPPADSPAKDAWEQYSITFALPASGACIGDTLQIKFTGPGGNGDHVWFDEFQLDANAVPLPGSPWLLGSGLLGLGGICLRRHRRQSWF